MTAPAVGPATARVYDRLPDVYREVDPDQPRARGYDDPYEDGTVGTYDGPGSYGGDGQTRPGYPLLRYLSLLLDQLTPVEVLYERLEFTPPDSTGRAPQTFGSGTYGSGTFGDLDTADLVDPRRADARWLPWLAQVLGVTLPAGTVDEQRDAVANPDTSWQRGTPARIAAAARSRLPAGSYADTSPRYRGDPYTIAVVTKRDETAGATTFAELKAIAPTWRELQALGDFGNIEAADVMSAAAVERPAGYRLSHIYLEDLYA